MERVESLIMQFIDGLILDMDADPDEIIKGLESATEAVRKQHSDVVRRTQRGWSHDE